MQKASVPEVSPDTYRGYILDPFQKKAISAIEANKSVLVSAPTGTGKTLVADYVIEKSFRQGKQVIYTAPIKALSNQKYKEFKQLLGDDNVGILTGDVVIHQDAPILIMTTEIFRNILHQNPSRLERVAYTIFDEVHYIDDPVRGSVWEESLIFMPPEMRFLGLSATIPNVGELAKWISSVQGNDVEIIRHFERAVPLEHVLFESGQGFTTFEQINKRFQRYSHKLGLTRGGKLAGDFPSTSHLDLIKDLPRDYLPCLFFAFSRRRCEAHANQLADSEDYLNAEEKARVKAVIAEQSAKYGNAGGRRVKELQFLLERGIGYHHAGLLPVAKDIVEELFEQRLIRVLYCTETFAVGLNFPCKTVCFDSMTKWDGTTFRPLSNREYFQIAGRAGRRGIDEKGYVITLVDMNYFSPDEFPSLRETDIEPLKSRFSLSYNTVLNLVRNYTDEEIEDVLRKNFAAYQNSEARTQIQDSIERLEAAKLRYAGCESMDTPGCPLQYQKKTSRVRSLKKRIQRRAAKGDHRGARSLRRRLRSLEGELGDLQEKQCRPEEVSACRTIQRQYRAAVNELGVLRSRLRELSPADAYVMEFQEKKALLAALDYLRDDHLTARGQFAAQINGQELVITDLFFRGIFHDWTESELNALAVSLDYEPRKGDGKPKQRCFDESPVRRVVALVRQMEETYLGYSTTKFNVHLADAAYHWSEGARFSEILQETQADEGDIVYAFRRSIDILRQVRNAAADDASLRSRLRAAAEKMDRAEVSILL